MVKKFEIRKKDAWLEKTRDKISLRWHGRGWVCFEEINPEALKEWLEEATKPRYRVKEEVREGFTSRFFILDYAYGTPNYPKERARFIDGDDFNAKKEAEDYCKQLNEGEE